MMTTNRTSRSPFFVLQSSFFILHFLHRPAMKNEERRLKNEKPCHQHSQRAVLAFLALFLCASSARAQRVVTFPPAEAQPPPAAKAPPKTIAGGEETDILIAPGPTMRKTQHRTPPPPTNLTIMYKVEYGTKLQYKHPDGTVEVFEQWKSYDKDAFNLVDLANKRLKDGNNYQYATRPLASKGFDPVDIPILYMTGDYDFTLTDSEVENLRKFLLDGGTIIFNAARGRDEFSKAVARELRRVFPQKPLMRLPLDHPIFNSFYRITDVTMHINGVPSTQPPEVYSMDVGTRAAAILVPGGLGTALTTDGPYHSGGKHIVGEKAKRLGVNLVAYMLGMTEYGKFLAQEFPVFAEKTRGGDVFRYCQVRYSGSWDVNPAIQNSLLRGLKTNTTVEVDYAPHTVALDDPEIGRFPLLWMTGHYEFSLTKAEAAGLADYLKRGGMLVVTSAGGLKPFDRGFRREMQKVFPEGRLVKLPPTHPLFVGGWNGIERVVYTPMALKDNDTLEYPDFYGLFVDGRLAVLYTPHDIMSGINRESNAYAKGVSADDALRLGLNIVTYSLSH
jgi:hypothetical protein